MQLEYYIKLEQTKALYNNLNLILIGSMGVVAVTTWVFWGNVNNTHLLAWFSAACAINFLRWLTCYGFSPNETEPKRIQYWLNLHVFWGFVNGAHWGLIPLFFLTSDVTVYTLFVTSVYTGYVSSAMSTDTAYFKSFFAFALPSSVLFVGRALYEGGELYTALAILVAFFLIMLSYLSRNAHQFFKEARELNFRNMELMEELVVQKETAEQATLAKDQFLAAASHDLRQPLNAVSLFVDALGAMRIEAAGKKVLEKIRHSMRALNSMLHGILDISRLDSSSVENHPIHFSLNETVDQLYEEYASRANAKNVIFNNRLTTPLPVFADTLLLNRILRNLIDNAVKYTEDGEITISGTLKQDHVILTIQDSGIGIPADQQKNVFNEFYQLNNPERDRQKGLGLGLSIVKRICDLIDVPLSLESTEGRGTTVSLILPRGDENKLEAPNTIKHTNFDNINVVVVDDEQDILDGMQHVLNGWGCTTIVGTDYAVVSALLVDQEILPGLIIADLRLRDDEDGIDTIEQLREEFNNEIPAILITGDTAPDRVKLAKNANVEVLYKPIEARELRKTIHELLSA